MSSSYGSGPAQREAADESGRSRPVGSSQTPAAPVGSVKDSGKAGHRTITYYAVALNPDGRIGQLLVTRVVAAGVKVSGSQEWTGVTYRSHREAAADLRRLNCGARS